jgi:hypothetical protein
VSDVEVSTFFGKISGLGPVLVVAVLEPELSRPLFVVGEVETDAFTIEEQ